MSCRIVLSSVGRYYERFADHAVAIARRVRYLAIDRTTELDAPGSTFSGQALTHHDDHSRDSRQIAATGQTEQTRHG
ncbi:MAG: hypothetical protein QOG46_546 [Pseudonocardiales bacterium]|nr:hypothetical protein [Pseudonocardiales bacterium]